MKRQNLLFSLIALGDCDTILESDRSGKRKTIQQWLKVQVGCDNMSIIRAQYIPSVLANMCGDSVDLLKK